MKVLITGAAGNLGKILTRHLISQNIAVTGIDMNECSYNFPKSLFSFYKCCITDKDFLKGIFKKEQPTHIIHFASTFNRVRNRKKELEIDVGGSKNILEISDETPSVKQIIYSSSAAAYGGHADNGLWLSEGDKLRPGRYRYGIIKKMVEELFFKLKVRDNLKIICLRICMVVGPSFNKKKCAISILINSKFVIKQWKNNKIQFLHEHDMNRLMTHIINDDKIRGIYNFATDSFSEVHHLIPRKKYINIPIPLLMAVLWILWNLRVVNLRPSCIKQSIYPIVLSPAKLISRYKYHFKYNTEEAFWETVKYIQLSENI